MKRQRADDLAHAPFRFIEPEALGALREACTIHAVKELDALPVGAVVRSGGDVFRRDPDDGPLNEFGGWWSVQGSEFADQSALLQLPALLIWHPGWDSNPSGA